MGLDCSPTYQRSGREEKKRLFIQNREIQQTTIKVKEKIINLLSLLISVAGFFFLVANLLNELSIGQITLTYFVVPLYLILLATYFFRRFLSFTVRVYGNLLVIFFVGTGSMYFYGMIGPGILFLLTASYLGTILLTNKGAMLFVLVNFLTFLIIGVLWSTESLTFNFEIEEYAYSFETFLLRITGYIFFLGLIVFTQYRLNKFLVTSIDELNGAHQELVTTEEELRTQYDEIIGNREAIRLSNEKYQILVEHTENLIYSLDPKGLLLSCNSSFRKLMGKHHKEFDKKNFFDLIDNQKSFKEHFQKHFNEALQSTESVYFVGSFHDLENEWRTFHITLTPVFNNHGKIYMIAGQSHDVTKLVKKEEKIIHLAYYDQLTGLPNRVLFEEEVSDTIKQNKSDGPAMAVMYFDLDNFKKVNDTLGHQAGDQLLKKITNRVSDILENEETLSRMGGDEFAILVKENKQHHSFYDQLDHLSRMIIGVIGRPVRITDVDFYLSASIGMVLYPEHGPSFEELMKNADTAMYQAKSLGKNQCHFYHSSLNDKNNEHIRMEAALRDAMKNGEFFIQYHPLVQSQTRDIRGFEALMRWNSVSFGSVPPWRFIPILEQTGLIIDYGEWIMREACEQIKKWNDATGKEYIISVNISSIQFKRERFMESVKRILDVSGLQPRLLEIEITESILIDDFTSVVEKLKELKEIGVRVALDDFGTGYSSLSYLRQLPIDTLKIDKSFIDDIRLQNQPKIIIGSIILLAHEMGLEVVAEGIEINQQALYLEEKQCDYMQGFYFYYPLDKQEIERELLQMESK